MAFCKTVCQTQLLLVALSFVTATSGLFAADDSRVHKDLEFAAVDGHSLKLDLYMPASSDPPLVVWIHGGGWREGSKEKCEVTWLTEHGYAVASISYRLTDKAIFPAQIHDCKAAVRWLRANAKKHGYSIDRIAVAGSSAGGHLAALLGTTGDLKDLEGTVGSNLEYSSRVDAIVDYYGATDFIQRTKSQPHKTIKEGSIVRLLLGGPADQKVELARLASSAFHVTDDDPPLLIFHGGKDNKVLIGQSERIVDIYAKAGLPVTVHVLEDSGHGGDEFYCGENRQRLVAFLDKYLCMDSSLPRSSPESQGVSSAQVRGFVEAAGQNVENDKAPSGRNLDWRQGYGFQFWRCRHGAYRGDGKDGQFCIVLPQQDAVIAITAKTRNMQGQLDLVWEHLLPAFHEKPLPHNEAELTKLKQTLTGLKITDDGT